MTTATLPAPEPSAAPPSLPSLRIVVADDEPDMRQFFQELLPPLGHQVFAAENGRQLVEQCRRHPPDLVIADIKMPGLDGLQAIAEVNRERRVPVILISGYHDAELLAQATADYVMSYLVKPVKPVDVQAAIVMAVSRFEHLQHARQEADTAKRALEERKAIEQAKGIVMRRLRIDEPEAFALMRELSSRRNWKLVETARRVLEADEIFRALQESDRR